MAKSVIILGIESSCDDTSAAVVSDTYLLSNVIAWQGVHREYGGVVPELASRAHQANIIPVVDKALRDAGVKKENLDAISFTRGPGLLGSLLVGTSFAKGLALSLNIPLIEVNHLHGHVLSHFLQPKGKENPVPDFPHLCLLISGGHTQIIQVESHLVMKVIGTTLDDAAGEAFDKIAKVMGLGYPGGPEIDKLAKEGNSHGFVFAKPKVPGLDFSFSGLKTSVLYFLRDKLKADKDFISNNINDLCASLQESIVNILLEKVKKAVKITGITEITFSGGVSANSEIRKQFALQGAKEGWKVFMPELFLTTDNAAMIAVTGYYKYINNLFCSHGVSPAARLPFNNE